MRFIEIITMKFHLLDYIKLMLLMMIWYQDDQTKIMFNVREKFFGPICSCPWTVSRCFHDDHDMRSFLWQKKNIFEMDDCKSEKYIAISEGEKKGTEVSYVILGVCFVRKDNIVFWMLVPLPMMIRLNHVFLLEERNIVCPIKC